MACIPSARVAAFLFFTCIPVIGQPAQDPFIHFELQKKKFQVHVMSLEKTEPLRAFGVAIRLTGTDVPNQRVKLEIIAESGHRNVTREVQQPLEFSQRDQLLPFDFTISEVHKGSASCRIRVAKSGLPSAWAVSVGLYSRKGDWKSWLSEPVLPVPRGQIFAAGGASSPEVLRRAPHTFAEGALQARIEGTVSLQVLVRKDGRADGFKILKSVGYGLDAKAIEAVANNWEFEPGFRNGSPVDALKIVELPFRLPGKLMKTHKYKFALSAGAQVPAGSPRAKLFDFKLFPGSILRVLRLARIKGSLRVLSFGFRLKKTRVARQTFTLEALGYGRKTELEVRETAQGVLSFSLGGSGGTLAITEVHDGLITGRLSIPPNATPEGNLSAGIYKEAADAESSHLKPFLPPQQQADEADSASQARGKVHTAGKEVKNPVLVRRTLPAYTDAAIEAKIQGTILLQVIFRKDGSVSGFKILKSLGYGLDERAIEEIANYWSFRPGTLKGKPVDVRATIEVTFTLR